MRHIFHLQNRMYYAIERTSAPSWNDELFTFLIWIGNLLCNLIPIFITLSLNAFILQNWIWRSNFWCALWLWIFVFCSKLSMFIFMWHTISIIYKQATGSIFRSLKSYLHDAFLPTTLIISMIHFCNLKMLILPVSPPPKIKLYLRWAWKYAK
jgi:hypothetical protein